MQHLTLQEIDDLIAVDPVAAESWSRLKDPSISDHERGRHMGYFFIALKRETPEDFHRTLKEIAETPFFNDYDKGALEWLEEAYPHLVSEK